MQKKKIKIIVVLVFSGWNLRCMDSGSMHHFVGADNSCISWGHAQYGELGYGPSGQKYVNFMWPNTCTLVLFEINSSNI